MPLLPSQVLHNRYRIVKLLGQGGFGAVYRAWDLSLQKPCALKENLDPQGAGQFSQEAQFLATLQHPNLPRVTDYFVTTGTQYLVMDYVEGENLDDLVQRHGPLSEQQAIPWIRQIGNALTYLHRQNPPIVHRDIKPANILITPDGRAMLVDFGIAKAHHTGHITNPQARGVTPGYSPPEQYGQGTDPRSDLYALGATLYYALTGQEPPESLLIQMGQIPLPSPRTHNGAISPAIEAAILKAMTLDRNARFPTSAAFCRALTASPVQLVTSQMSGSMAHTGTASVPAGIQPAGVKWLIPVILLACLALALFAGGAGWVVSQAGAGGGTSLPSGITKTPTLPGPEPTTLTPSLPPAVSTPSPSPTPTATSIAQNYTATPTFTPSPTHTATETPTFTLTPSPTSTPFIEAPEPTLPGGWIAFQSNRNNTDPQKHDIYLIHPDGTGLTQLTTHAGDERAPTWAWNGNRVAYQAVDGSYVNLFFIKLDKGDPIPVFTNTCNDYAPNFNSSNTLLVFHASCKSSGEDKEIMLIQTDGTGRIALTTTSRCNNWYPFWNPDGRSILFTSNCHGTEGKYFLYRMEAQPNATATPLAPGCMGSYSPDGTRIVFATYCLDSGEIWVMNADGSNPQQITHDGRNRNPAWSPDGNWIVFQYENSENDHDLYIMDVNGNNRTQLTSGPDNDASPSWQPFR